ncbi:MAG: translocation/assembly module TamB domain-containing protein [Roseibium sp.]
MRFFKFTLRILAFLISVAIAVPVLTIAMMQVPIGRTLVSNVASSLASTEHQSVKIEDLYLKFGLDVSVARIIVSDSNGIWLELDNLKTDWSPLQLVNGDLKIEAVTASQINLIRKPVAAPEASSASDPTSNEDVASRSGLPFNVTLEQLSIGEINLGEPLLGAPISLSATGSGAADFDPAMISANLDIKRIDGVDAQLVATAEFEPTADTLSFDIDITEPRGGMAARLLDLPDLPALSLNLSGDGPLDNWAADLAVALDSKTTVTGSATLSEAGAFRHLTFDLDGDLASLAPPEAQAFLLGNTNAKGKAVFSSEFSPQSGQINLKTQTVSLSANGDLSGNRLKADVDLSISAGDDALIAVDLADRRIAFGPFTAKASLDGALDDASWRADIYMASFQTNEIQTDAISLTLSGNDGNLDQKALKSPFELKLNIQQLDGLTEQTAPLSGPISLSANGIVDGAAQSANLAQMSAALSVATLDLNNTYLSPSKASGQGKFLFPDLGQLSDLAQRQLAGSVNSAFSFDMDPSTVKGTAGLSAITTDLETGIAQADTMLSGKTQLDTTIALNGPEDVTVKTLSLANEALTINGNARYQPLDAISDIVLKLSDLAKLDPQLEGALELAVQTTGPVDSLSITANASSSHILLAKTPLEDLEFSAQAIADANAPTATIKTTASMNGQPISVDVELKSENGGADISPLSIELVGNTVAGAIAIADLQNPVGTFSGDLKIDAPDLSTLSPLALMDLNGRIEGSLKADPENKLVSLDLTGADIDVPSLSLGSMKLRANIAAPYDPQTLSADLVIEDMITSATPIHSATITAKPEGNGTSLSALVKMDTDTDDGLSMTVNLSQPSSDSYLLALNKLALKYQGISSQLKQPTSISYAAGTASIQPLELQLGGGSLSVAGQAGEKLDIQATLNNVPLDLADAFAPSLGLGGTLSGTASVTGISASPDAQWSLIGSGLTATELRANGLSALALSSTGNLSNNQITQSSKVTGDDGLSLNTKGTVGLNAPMPLAIEVDGSIPMATLRRPLLEAGLRADGSVALTGSVSGNAQAPAYQITASPSGLKVTSLSTGLTVQNIRGAAVVNQDQASLNGIAGDLATGGSLSASGTVGMTDGFTTNLELAMDKARYVDPGLVTAEIDAKIKVSGPLASTSNSALIGGTVTINKADVSIPESLPGAIAAVEVRHVNASKAIRQQVAELGGEPKQSNKQSTSNPPRLDIILSAPGRIFIRGRGLDAELEGNLKIVGTTENPQAIGAFSLKRGQLNILSRRLTFSRGSATFEGSLTPLIDFAATTSVSDTTITVTVSGEADDPEIKFNSSPELPQDEVLALLLFGKSVGNLSATQVAQLAASISTLTGGSDDGPLAQIRKSLGLDAIDINTDGEDGPTVGVGKYINDNIYLGVEQGAGSGTSRVQVDIDLDRGVKVRGEVGADGSSKAGIFFEREY